MIDHLIIREAEEELRDATRFYESRATGLSLDFLSEIEKSIQSIKDSPVNRGLLSKEKYGDDCYPAFHLVYSIL